MVATSSPPVAVVGAGIIGASIAYHLARAGAPVLVVDTGGGGGVTTPTSWAWLNASWGNPEPYVRLRRRSIAEWHRLASELPGLPIHFRGSLTADLTAAELADYVRQHSALGYRLRLVGRDEMRHIEPRLRHAPEVAAFCEEEGAVEPVAAAVRLREAAVALGARFLSGTTVRRIVLKGGAAAGVDIAGDNIPVERVVIAAGIASPGLLADTGFKLPFSTPEGLLAHSQIMPPVLSRLLVLPGIHVRQTAEGRLVAGFDFSGTIIDAPDIAAARLIARINELIDLPEPARLDHMTIGLRPTPGDGFPAVGWVPGVAGVYLAVMHSGMTLAPAVGLFAASELRDGHRDALLAPYGPERFLA